MRPLSKAFLNFLHLESTAGLLLMASAVLALIISNSHWAPWYADFLAVPVEVRFGDFFIGKPLLLWVNDGLMAVFFLLVGLEIKREVYEGSLSSREAFLLPLIAALGGMVIPAAIYVAINRNDSAALQGWAIPAATDIAFALGVLALLGSRVPSSLKVFLTALAIIDDLGAIVIIALFYTIQLKMLALAMAAACLAVLAILNRNGVTKLSAYLFVGALLWVFVLKSGVHATLAGVAVALAIPLKEGESGEGPLHRLERDLHPLVAYAILPLFAFANSGISLAGVTPQTLIHPITLGIALGLLVGKVVGIFGFSYAAVRMGIARMPENANWRTLWGTALLCGIGFTMSLFIGDLAFRDGSGDYAVAVRLGVFGGSLLSALAGYLFLWKVLPER